MAALAARLEAQVGPFHICYDTFGVCYIHFMAAPVALAGCDQPLGCAGVSRVAHPGTEAMEWELQGWACERCQELGHLPRLADDMGYYCTRCCSREVAPPVVAVSHEAMQTAKERAAAMMGSLDLLEGDELPSQPARLAWYRREVRDGAGHLRPTELRDDRRWNAHGMPAELREIVDAHLYKCESCRGAVEAACGLSLEYLVQLGGDARHNRKLEAAWKRL